MRLLRLRLANYRGIESSEVEFAVQGLTIVEGPNEIGKTSLGEAIRLLFDYLDSSKHSDIKAIKPVSLDAGTEIELEAESGPYAFTYFKRFHKKPETTLTISSPKSENYTGREAHEQAEEILKETIDVSLWKALCIQQGEEIQQANLSKQTSLSAALDIAAGGQSVNHQEESLFDKIRDEYLRYFTERGAEKKNLQEAEKALQESVSAVDRIESQIEDLEADIRRAADLERELSALKSQEDDLRRDVAKYTESLNEIGKLESILETAHLKLESAQKSEQACSLERKARQDMIEAVSRARKAQIKLKESSAASTESNKAAENSLASAQSASEVAEARRQEADSLVRLHRADFDYFNNKLHLEQLEERKSRIDRAREDSASADEVLETNRVDEETLKSIQDAERRLILAQAKLETGAPNILLRGLGKSEFLVDEKSSSISKDEEINLPISDRVRVTIPGAMQIEVTAGASSAELSRMVQEVKQELDTLCKGVGVTNADGARVSHEIRREAQRSAVRQNEIQNENLRDLTYEELEKKVITLRKSVPGYTKERVAEPKLPSSIDAAKDLLRSTEMLLEEVHSAWEEARAELDTARSVRDKLSEQHQLVRVELDLKTEELVRAEEELTRSRDLTTDDGLELKHSEFMRLVEAEDKNVEMTKSNLAEKDPERMRDLAETAIGSLKTAEEKRGAAQKENTEVLTRLKVFGEQGLQEKLDVAQSHLAHIERDNKALFRRARASKLLYTVMKEERDKARRAYVAPLKEKIERLGRLVFDSSFEVELGDDLSVERRSMKGSGVPFEYLSGGTKEQISLIARLACAMTVSEDGGATLILDDALGYTDPERLKLMGAVLAKAGKECQIVVLTCVPERYSNVGEATVVRLG